jgi:hypothetical protein
LQVLIAMVGLTITGACLHALWRKLRRR